LFSKVPSLWSLAATRKQKRFSQKLFIAIGARSWAVNVLIYYFTTPQNQTCVFCLSEKLLSETKIRMDCHLPVLDQKLALQYQ
jgi:Na+/melibiose symporter-like transporter